MEVYCKGTARIRHHATGEVYEIESDELDWDAVGGDEREMGQEICYQTMVKHAVLGELTWGLWEYPVGIENHHVTNGVPKIGAQQNCVAGTCSKPTNRRAAALPAYEVTPRSIGRLRAHARAARPALRTRPAAAIPIAVCRKEPIACPSRGWRAGPRHWHPARTVAPGSFRRPQPRRTWRRVR